MLRGPVQRAGEPRAAVQLAWVATTCVPLTCAAHEVSVQAPPDPVFLEPRAVARPLAQQRLMRDLYFFVADGQQASVGQCREHALGAVDSLELGERHAAA